MAPFLIAALIGVGLFGGGTAIKPSQPVIGSVMQGAGVGTVLGGGLGSIAGAAGVVGTTTVGATVAVGAGLGAAGGGAGGYELSQHPVTIDGYTLSAQRPIVIYRNTPSKVVGVHRTVHHVAKASTKPVAKKS